MNSLGVYGQDLLKNKLDSIKPKIDLILVNGDTLFTMNRKFAEQIAIEHDSLVIVVDKLKECKDVLTSSLELKEQYRKALETSEGVSDMLRRENSSKDKIINSYKKIDESQQSIQSELTKQFNKIKNRNKWLVGLTIGGVSVGFTSIILLLLK
jgi:hypothetical protein